MCLTVFKRLVTFGDSWTTGDCRDLVQLDPDILNRCNITHDVENNAYYFKRPWPVILAEKLNLEVKNYAISGLPNAAILSNIYDANIFGHLNPEKDLVIVLLSTWHRQCEWSSGPTKFSSIYFPQSSANYRSRSIIDQATDIKTFNALNSHYEKLAYQTFLDFYSIVNFLENLKFKYYIGYAFSNISDFSPYIHSYYTRIMKINKNILDSFQKYAPSTGMHGDILVHPNEEEHNVYADYLAQRILKDHGNVR